MTWINHLGMWLMFMFVLNVAECFSKKPFNRTGCPGLWVPSAAGTALFVGIEIFLGLVYMIIM